MKEFMGHTLKEHLDLITNGYKRWATVPHVSEASAEEISYWVALAKCTTCNIPGQTFDDIFWSEEVTEYVDRRGLHLPGFVHEIVLDQVQHHMIRRMKPSVTTQLEFIKYDLLPKFEAALMTHLTGLVFALRNELGGENGNPPPKIPENLPCPALVTMVQDTSVSM